MLSRAEIKAGYLRAKDERDRQTRLMDLYKHLFDLRKKMEYLAEKYPDLMWTDCPERKGKSVPLAFCIEKCTGKCADWKTIQKHHPKLLEVVTNINAKFDKTLRILEEAKRA